MDKALELQENMSPSNDKVYCKSPHSEKTASALNRTEGNQSLDVIAPPQPCSRHDEPAISSNAGARGNQPHPPRLAHNKAWHTINNNHAQAGSNHSAPDFRLHLNARRAETTRNNNDDDVGPKSFGPAIRSERFHSSFKGPREVPKYNATMNLKSGSKTTWAS